MHASAGSSSDTSFMVLSVSIVGILATSLLLLTYYLFLTKCGLASSSWLPNRDDAAHTQPHSVVLVPYDSPVRRGLEEAAIRRIPTFRYRKPCQAQVASECAVCLSEFQAGERLRLLPPCLHAFHIDCIDAWLHATANCPLCRAALSDSASDCHHLDIVTVLRAVDDAAASVVIDVASPGGNDVGGNDHDVAAIKEHSSSKSSMGDECIIDARRRGDRRELLGVQQPMRRSLSMDSCGDKHFYLALQKILQQQQHSAAVVGEDGKGESSTSASAAGRSSGRLRRSFFSFSQGRSPRARSAILPI